VEQPASLIVTSWSLQLDQSPLGMPSRDYFLKGRDEPALKSYEQYVVNVAVAMGAPRDRAVREIAQMVDFEILLANVSFSLITPPTNGVV